MGARLDRRWRRRWRRMQIGLRQFFLQNSLLASGCGVRLYKPGQVYLEKDVILPYVANVDVCDAKCLSVTESQRKTLIFFRGRLKRNAGGKIRAKLVDELRNKEGGIIEDGTIGQAGKKASQDGMRSSVFCLSPAGDTPSSARLFDAIVSGCIPVIVSDELELPFEGLLNYNKMAVFVSSRDALQPGWLLAHLKAIDPSKIKDMRVNLAQSVRHFLYSSPAQPLGPEDLTWRMAVDFVTQFNCKQESGSAPDFYSFCTGSTNMKPKECFPYLEAGE